MAKIDNATLKRLIEGRDALFLFANELGQLAGGPMGASYFANLCHMAANDMQDAGFGVDRVILEGSTSDEKEE